MARHPIKFGVLLFFLCYIAVISYFQSVHHRAAIAKAARAKQKKSGSLRQEPHSAYRDHYTSANERRSPATAFDPGAGGEGEEAEAQGDGGKPAKQPRTKDISMGSITISVGDTRAGRYTGGNEKARSSSSSSKSKTYNQSGSGGNHSGTSTATATSSSAFPRQQSREWVAQPPQNGESGDVDEHDAETHDDFASAASSTKQPARNQGLRPLVASQQSTIDSSGTGRIEGSGEDNGKGLRPLAEFVGEQENDGQRPSGEVGCVGAIDNHPCFLGGKPPET